MKVILINGSPHEKGCTHRGLQEVERTLNECGLETELIWLGTDAVSGCRGCGACRNLGRCVIDDKVNAIAEKIVEADGLVLGSPVHYASASGTLSVFMDRLFYAHSGKLAGKPACAISSSRRGGNSATMDQLNKYFTIASMPVVSGQYWNMVHGAAREDVEQDGEGLQTMRSLGRNMAWLLTCIELGKQNGICFPEKETPIRTPFIR